MGRTGSYTSLSLPYHIGNGGMPALLATAIVATTGNIYAGLWYPIGISALTFVIGGSMLRDTKGVDLASGFGYRGASTLHSIE